MRLLLLITLGLSPFILFAQKQETSTYQLNAEVNFPKGDETGRKIYFVYQKNGKQKTDSTLISNNKFSFSGTSDIAIRTSLQFTKPYATPEPDLDPNTLSLYLNNGLTEVKATGFLSRAQVVGSALQDEYTAFKKKYTKWDMPIIFAGRRKRSLGKNDSLKLQSINKSLDSIQNLKMNELCLFLNEGIAKPYAVEAILMYLKTKGSSLDVSKADLYFKQLPEDQQQSAEGQQAEVIIADLKKHIKNH